MQQKRFTVVLNIKSDSYMYIGTCRYTCVDNSYDIISHYSIISTIHIALRMHSHQSYVIK